MSTVPPTDSFEFPENSAQNEAALEELTSAIAFGQGADTITLLVVRCNYSRLQDQMVERLGQRLAGEELQGPVQVLQLGTDDYNLYAQLQRMQRQGFQTGAVLVLGMDRLASLEVFLVELNKRREEFRREFPFPVVLWFTDEGYRLLSQYANDFESIVGGETIEFILSSEALTHGLQAASDHLFETLLALNTPKSFNKQLQQLNFLGYLQPHELSWALEGLRLQGIELAPDLQASVAFARGLDVPNQEAIKLFQQSADYWHTQVDKQLRYGLSLFYLGRAQYYAIDSTQYRSADWEVVVPPLQDCLIVFEHAERPDLMAKCINQLERVLHRLGRWEELEATAQKALDLHQRYSGTSKQAQDYGFLADVSLQQQQWQQGAKLAQLALDTLNDQDSWWRLLYLKMLAEAKYKLGDRETAITQLQAAQTLGVMDHPTLYSGVLLQLQECLREQGEYLRAFEIKRERLAIEKQYGLRAFIGAGRLRSHRIEQRMTVRSERETLEEIAPEIKSSGRQQDLTELLSRIAGKTHKLLVVHGTSGVGKSSLINGGLLPALRRRALENRQNVPVLMRKYTDWPRELVKALGKALASLNLLERDFSDFLNLSKKELSRVSDETTSGIAPLKSKDFISLEKSTSTLTDQILDTLCACEENTLRPVLLFDQFEEFFFANPDPLERRTFFQFVADCLDLPGALKIVFSVREDYLHYLLEARQLVKRKKLGPMAQTQLEDILGKQILYEIGNFTPEDTKAIIQNLASGSRMYLEPELVDALVQDLAGPLQEVRPIEMQVVGAQLQTEGIRTLVEYQTLGAQPKETLVQRYLDDVVVDCGEENRPLAELVLFLLTDDRGTRPLKTRPVLVRELEKELEVGDTNILRTAEKMLASLDLVLRILCGSGVVVYLPDTPDDHYQLVHDYLAGVIRRARENQQQKTLALLESTQKEKQAIEIERDELAKMNRALTRAQNNSRTFLATTIISIILLFSVVSFFLVRRQGRRVNLAQLDAIERLGVNATLQFENSQITSLIAALGASEELRELVGNISPETSPDLASLMFPLQKAAHQISEKNHFEVDFEDGAVLWAELSPNAQTLVFGSGTGKVHIQSLTSPKMLEIEAHESGAAVWSISFSPDGETFATAGGDGFVRLWTLSGQEKLEIANAHGPGNAVSGVRFSPDGETIVTVGDDGIVRMWDLSGETLTEFLGHNKGIFSVDFSQDGKKIATAGGDGIARVWTLAGGKVAEIRNHDNGVISAKLSPNGEEVATAGADGTARLWTLAGEQIALMEGHEGLVTDVGFSPDGKHIVTTGDDGTVRIWNSQGELTDNTNSTKFKNAHAIVPLQETDKFLAHESRIWSLAFSTNGDEFVTAGADRTVRIWSLTDRSAKEPYSQWQGHLSREVWATQVSPDGQTIATAGDDGLAFLWTKAGEVIAQLGEATGSSGALYWTEFSPDGDQLVTVGEDGFIRLWHAKTGKLIREWRSDETGVLTAAYSPDGATLITSSPGGVVRHWTIHGTLMREFRIDADFIYRVSFSPDGQYLVTASDNELVQLWELDGQAIRTLGRHPGGALWASFSPDGKSVISSGRDAKAKLSDLDGKQIVIFSGHEERVPWVGFSNQGNLIATAGADGTVKIWSLSGEAIAEYDGHNEGVFSVDFSNVTDWVAVGDGNGRIRVWKISSLNDLIHQGCDWLESHWKVVESSEVEVCRNES